VISSSAGGFRETLPAAVRKIDVDVRRVPEYEAPTLVEREALAR
jgi:hypothetical protein